MCDTGPYRFLRHPGYAGSMLPLFGIVLALGSVWTLIPAAVATIIAVIRTALEDKTLQEELPGYRDYAQRVRYRLIPGFSEGVTPRCDLGRGVGTYLLSLR